MAFVHLHNHSEYSLLDGATKVTDMARQAREFGMSAIAITDHGYLYGVPAFVTACKEQGVKPIIGCEIYFTPDRDLKRDRKPELYHLVLLAKNLEGYHNLIKICSIAATEAFYYKPRVTIDLIRTYAQGLIATSACIAGVIPQSLIADDTQAARTWALELSALFDPGDFYIELQDQGIVMDPRDRKKSVDLQDTNVLMSHVITQRDLNRQLVALASELGLKTVATNDMHYLRREDAYTQDIMLCIGTNSRYDDAERMRFENDQFFMKSEDEMRTVFKDYPEACDNTLEIAEKCNVELPREYILPVIPLPPGETNESMLYKEALQGLREKYGDPIPQEALARFEYEHSVICQQGFPAYFLVVQEFVRWARQNGVGVGPGRGSAAGSIISYALGITALDPLENGLLFERFLSLERPEMPDIDVDFDEEGRFKVIEHLRELYGAQKVAHVITYNSLKAKQAIVDTTRVFDYPVYIGQNISKKIPFGPDVSLQAVLGIHPDEKKNREQANIDLITEYQDNPDTKKIIDAALALEGTIRGEGVHASAVIICRDPVDVHVPVKLDTKGGMIITQYDHKSNAELGLLKMDFLGLRTLNVLMRAKEYVKINHGVDIDLDAIPFDDPKVFELLQRGETAGVFQVESSGMTSLIRSMNVDRYSDVVATIGLFRPGPLNSGMADDYVARKTGKRPVVYYDNRLADILEETFGTMVYQEQVMQISMRMSGFTAGESDVVRSAMAKKKIKIMKEDLRTWADGSTETMQDHWLNGAERNGYDRAVAQRIWDDVEKFAEYAFNKSHSAAYAILVMQTAWIKAHYRIEFMAAVLSSFVGRADRLTHYIASCKQCGIDVLPPDVNSSGREFTPLAEGIRFGLAGIRGVGEAAADVIIAERERIGLFSSLHDFVFRVPNATCNKRAVEALIKAGAFDSTGYTRRQMMRFIEEDNLMESAAKRWRDKTDGQVSIFDMFEEEGVDSGFEERIPAPDGVEWNRRTKLGFEKEILKMYVSDHPLAPYRDTLAEVSDYSIGLLSPTGTEEEDEALAENADRVRKVPQNRVISLAGMVSGLTPMVSKKGDRMAKFVLEDLEGSIEAIMFPQAFAQYGSALIDDAIVKVKCRFEQSDRGSQILVSEVLDLELDQDAPRPHPLEISVAAESFNQQVSDGLMELLKRFPGADPVILSMRHSTGRKFRADLPFTVDSHSTVLQQQLKALLG